MSFADTVVNVTIDANTDNPTAPNSTTPAIMAYHVHNTDLIRTYTDLDGMVSDGFSTTEPAYLWASRMLAQNPRPPEWKIIRATTAIAQAFTFVVTSNTAGDSVGLTLVLPDGSEIPCYFTVTVGLTLTQVATALELLIEAVADITSTSAIATITAAVGTAGVVVYPKDIRHGTFTDTSATVLPGHDLDLVIDVDDDWYGLTGVWISATTIDAIADWVEANGNKIHAYVTADTNNVDAQTGIFMTLKNESYQRSNGTVRGYPSSAADGFAAGMLGQMLPPPAGSATWAFKSVAGAAIDELSSTRIANIRAQNGSFYVSLANVNSTFDGKSAESIYMDLVQGIDSLRFEMRTDIIRALVQSPKIPYTQKGINSIAAIVAAVLQRAVGTGFLSDEDGFQFQVMPPTLADIAAGDKLDRILRNLKFTAFATNAIQTVFVNGVVNI